MLRFVYTGQLLSDEQALAVETRTDEESMKREFATSLRPKEYYLSHYARMHAVGCRFDVPLIRSKTVTLFKKGIVGAVYTEDVAMAIRVAYNTGSEIEHKMRDGLFNLLIHRPALIQKHVCVQDAIEETPSLARKLVVAMASKEMTK
jgi:hypothetical protein